MTEPVKPQAGKNRSLTACSVCGRAGFDRCGGWVYYLSGGVGPPETGVCCVGCVGREVGRGAAVRDDPAERPPAAPVSVRIVHTLHRIHSRLTRWTERGYSPATSEWTSLPNPPWERRRMAEQAYPLVEHKITCIECSRSWVLPTERWRVLLTDDDPPKAVAYCQACAEREFD
jgi:hypothetical protein